MNTYCDRRIFLLLLVLVGYGSNIEGFMEGFASSISQMSGQLTKFMEGVQQSVDSWADKVIDNAKQEECFFTCPKGQKPEPRDNYTYDPIGCITFGMEIKDSDLPTPSMRNCCNEQQLCYHRCNSTKNDCDHGFQNCLHLQCMKISSDSKQLMVCDTATKLLLMGILSFGCKSYKDAQKEACVCPDRKEL